MKRLRLLAAVGEALAGLGAVATLRPSPTAPVDLRRDGDRAVHHYDGPDSWSWGEGATAKPWTPDRRRLALVEQEVVIVAQVREADDGLAAAKADLYERIVSAVLSHGPLWEVVDPIHGGLTAMSYTSDEGGDHHPSAFKISMRFVYRDTPV